ncbi:MAG: MobH family relaxase [Candidatus Sedimenticola sp. (ex Thyasira tokunagai)]
MLRLRRQDKESVSDGDLKNGIRPVLTADKLLNPRSRCILLQEIQNLVSIPARHYGALFDIAIRNYACFVQELPASEIHHHAAPGGMLDHGLEVTKGALAIRRGHMLPPGAEPESIAKQADRWTYAVFTGALMHDIGKPAVDQIIRILDSSQRPLGRWISWNGPMQVDSYYQMDFVRPRRYGLHQRVGPLLAQWIIPSVGLAWLAEDQAVFEPWVSLISGDMETSGVLGQIIHEADSRSVARSLGAGATGRFPSARAIPLHKKLLTGLRYLIDEGHLPLNRNGAAGWLDHEDLWLVSKRTVDALRDHLHQEGHTDIPSRNDRIFDVLQEHAILKPNGEQAIWRTKVTDSAGEWSHELTLLRFAHHWIWPNLEAAPVPFSGSITVIPATGSTPETVTSEKEASTAGGTVPVPGGPGDAPPAATIETRTTGEETILSISASTGNKPNDQMRENESHLETQKVQATACTTTILKEQTDAGEQFLTWLRAGLASGDIIVNDVRARVHTVPDGILIVSPAIFKDFARQSGCEWNHVQKRFQKLQLHEKTPQGTNIHSYYTIGERKKSTINGLLICDPSKLFQNTAPSPNPYLSKK